MMEGPKRLLAIDGGGIRGMIALGYLEEIETGLRQRLGAGPGFVLADWFHYIGGTSTGAIIATGLALGMKVSQLRSFYVEQGRAMFGRARVLHRLRYRFEDGPLAQALRDAFGAERTLGSADLRTLLLVTLRNASTDSPWPLSSNPAAQYNDRALPDCNLDLPLWQIVRASTAAPTFFPPEVVQVGPRRFIFEDGGVTPYNNPAFLLFLMATTAPYRLQWPTGPERLLLVSVGTGSMPQDGSGLQPQKMSMLYQASAIPTALIFAGANQQDLMCRMFGKTLAGPALDGEVGAMLATEGGSGLVPLFTYIRYNADLTRRGLDALGLHDVEPASVQRMDGVQYLDELTRLGRAAGTAQVQMSHFEGHMG